MHGPIPEEVARFVLAAVPSVTYLEAMLLLRSDSGRWWNAKSVAERLYTSERTAGQVLTELVSGEVLVRSGGGDDDVQYRYEPRWEELRRMIDQLAEVYALNLVEVTHLIHSTMDRKAQRFADAFRWRKDS